MLVQPRQRVLTIPYRRANPFFQLAEPVWILAGRSDAEWICRYNSQLRQYLDGGPDFHGAYGKRLRRAGFQGTADQLKDVLAQLRLDAGSRRAATVLRDPELDNPQVETRDMPCNIACTYQLRDGKLWAATFNRSNDLVLGLSYTNIVQFTTIQEALACELGVDVGEYSHFSSSLHVYEDDPIVRRLVENPHVSFDVYRHVPFTRMAPGPALARAALLARTLDDPVDCPYWESVRRMLRAWGHLHGTSARDNVERCQRAVDELHCVAAQDWAVAAWEFLWRWAARRHVTRHVYLPDYPAVVLAYIKHDGAVQPSLPEYHGP